MILLAWLMQAQELPDLEFNASVRARDVRIEQRGQAQLTVTAQPDAGSAVVVEKSTGAAGRARLRNVRVDLRAQARIGTPEQNTPAQETPTPQ